MKKFTDTLQQNVFSWPEYTILIILLIVSILIGMYFSLKKNKTSIEYLSGDGQMKLIPIFLSSIASHFSAVNLLGLPADVYRFGASYVFVLITMIFVPIIAVNVFLPVYYNLKIYSIYTYLERRFDKKTKSLASGLSILIELLSMPLFLFAPVLAFSTVTKVNFDLALFLASSICIFYTTIGGLKGVVWTDVFQFSLTILFILVVAIVGTVNNGGFLNIFSVSWKGHRLDIFDFQPSLTKRDDFWSVVIGGIFGWSVVVNSQQTTMQKFLSLPNYTSAKRAIILFSMGQGVIKCCCIFLGLIIYAQYAHCDPFTTKTLKSLDQLVPYYIIDTLGHVPGITGLFIAGILSTGFSTLSAHMNCIAGQMYQDFIIQKWPKLLEQSEAKKKLCLKLLVVASGVFISGSVLLYKNLDSVFVLIITVRGFIGGPMFGLVTLGMVFRRSNSNGAFYGSILALMVMAVWVGLIQYYKSFANLLHKMKPVAVDQCIESFNITEINSSFTNRFKNSDIQVPAIFQISHFWICALGFVFTIVFGLTISHFSKSDEKVVDEELLSPFVRRNRSVTVKQKRTILSENIEIVAKEMVEKEKLLT